MNSIEIKKRNLDTEHNLRELVLFDPDNKRYFISCYNNGGKNNAILFLSSLAESYQLKDRDKINYLACYNVLKYLYEII